MATIETSRNSLVNSPAVYTQHIPSILREIFLFCEEQPNSSSSLRNLRLCSKQFCEIVSPITFQTLSIKSNHGFKSLLALILASSLDPHPTADRPPLFSNYFTYLNLHIVPSANALEAADSLFKNLPKRTLFPKVTRLKVGLEALVDLTGMISRGGDDTGLSWFHQHSNEARDDKADMRYKYSPLKSRSIATHRDLFRTLANPQDIILGGPKSCDPASDLLTPYSPFCAEDPAHLKRIHSILTWSSIRKIVSEDVHTCFVPAIPDRKTTLILSRCVCLTAYSPVDYHASQTYEDLHRITVTPDEIPTLPHFYHCTIRQSRLMSALVEDIGRIIKNSKRGKKGEKPKGSETTWDMIVRGDISPGGPEEKEGFRSLERLICAKIKELHPDQTVFQYEEEAQTISCFKYCFSD